MTKCAIISTTPLAFLLIFLLRVISTVFPLAVIDDIPIAVIERASPVVFIPVIEVALILHRAVREELLSLVPAEPLEFPLEELVAEIRIFRPFFYIIRTGERADDEGDVDKELFHLIIDEGNRRVFKTFLDERILIFPLDLKELLV